MKTPSELGLPAGLIVPPEGGWKPRTYYIIDVAYSGTNPIHKSIMYSSFLDGNCLSRHRVEIFNGTYEEINSGRGAAYIKAISEIEGMEK